MPSNVLINGVNYSWSNISVILFGTPITGIVSISYKRKQKKENNYGAGVKPVSRGYGMEEYEGELELYTDVWKQIIAASPNRNPMEIPPFDIPVSFSGSGVLVTKDVLRSVEFTEDPLESKSGDTKITCKIPLVLGGIDR